MVERVDNISGFAPRSPWSWQDTRNNFILGFSYDQSLKNFIDAPKSLSSLEVSLIYIENTAMTINSVSILILYFSRLGIEQAPSDTKTSYLGKIPAISKLWACLKAFLLKALWFFHRSILLGNHLPSFCIPYFS